VAKSAYSKFLTEVGKAHDKALHYATMGRPRGLASQIERMREFSAQAQSSGDYSMSNAIERDVAVLKVKLDKLKRLGRTR
jgi:hypothetical protein